MIEKIKSTDIAAAATVLAAGALAIRPEQRQQLGDAVVGVGGAAFIAGLIAVTSVAQKPFNYFYGRQLESQLAELPQAELSSDSAA